MAENSGRGNSIDAADAPKGGDMDPPPVASEVKGAVKDAAKKPDGTGVHASGQEAGMLPDPRVKVKTKAEDESENQRER
ncbi:hypothetical protein GGR51DRAFT_515920 [Nemania sp. FL0031]|nr:hypothetical protein GGR51DRAFT_515920 [Nemania sp. FL0031]